MTFRPPFLASLPQESVPRLNHTHALIYSSHQSMVIVIRETFPHVISSWHNSQIQISLQYGTPLNVSMVPFYISLTSSKVQRVYKLQHTLRMAQAVPDPGFSPYLLQTWKTAASKSLNSCDLRNDGFDSFYTVWRDSWPLLTCLSIAKLMAKACELSVEILAMLMSQ